MRRKSCTGPRGGNREIESPRHAIANVARPNWPGDVGVNGRRCSIRVWPLLALFSWETILETQKQAPSTERDRAVWMVCFRIWGWNMIYRPTKKEMARIAWLYGRRSVQSIQRDIERHWGIYLDEWFVRFAIARPGKPASTAIPTRSSSSCVIASPDSTTASKSLTWASVLS